MAWGRVYLGGLDGRVYSFVEKTGELAWSHSTGAEVYPSPAVAETPHSPPTVYVGSQDKHFYALDARTGEVRWDRSVGGIVLGSSSVVGETVYVSVIGPNIGTFGYDVETRQEGLLQRPGRVQPGDLRRQEDLPDRYLDDPRLQAASRPPRRRQAPATTKR